MASSWPRVDDLSDDKAFERLHSGLTVWMIATPRDSLTVCDLQEPLYDALSRNTERYDFLPVVALEDGTEPRIVGLLHTERFSGSKAEGPVREHFDPLSEEHLIGVDASILEFVKEADHKPCRLVVSGARIVGLVSLSDLQQLPARAALFALITGLEMTMTLAIKSRCGTDDDWLGCLSEGRQGKIQKEIDAARVGNSFVDALLFTQFCDKADIVARRLEMGLDKNVLKAKLRKIQKLRDNLAHANEYAASMPEARVVCETVRNLLVLRAEIARTIRQ